MVAAAAALSLSTRSFPAHADDTESYEAALTRGVVARDRALETKSTAYWREALAAFGEAVSRRSSREAWFELGAAAAELTLDDEAFEAYEQALELGLDGRAAELARAFLGAHEPNMARLDVRGARGAAVSIRMRSRGVLPLAKPLVVPAGAVRVRVELAGFEPWERDLPVAAKNRSLVEVALVPLRSAEPSSGRSADPPSEARHGARAERGSWGSSALIGGGALAVASAGTIIVTSLLLAEERDTLERSCVVRSKDECARTTASRRAEAQSAADTILTLKVVRWGAVAGASVGVAAAAAGLVNLWAPAEHASLGGLVVGMSREETVVRWRRAF